MGKTGSKAVDAVQAASAARHRGRAEQGDESRRIRAQSPYSTRNKTASNQQPHREFLVVPQPLVELIYICTSLAPCLSVAALVAQEWRAAVQALPLEVAKTNELARASSGLAPRLFSLTEGS